jgi:ATP-dependent Clp protease ATP-binding subunit ClpA
MNSEPHEGLGPGDGSEAGRDWLERLPAERFNPRARRILITAAELARKNSDPYIGSEHLLLALVQEGRGTAWSFLDQLGGVNELQVQLQTFLTRVAEERSKNADQ